MSRSQKIELTQWHSGKESKLDDHLALEEPLQIIVDGHPLAVMMRTPGHDEELTAGFLLTEGIVTSKEEIARIDTEERPNHALVFLADGITVDHKRLTRHLFSASSCGLCGKATIEAITRNNPPLTTEMKFGISTLLHAPEQLRASQSTFQETGGLHASGIFSHKGTLIVSREDVGRHNALDKVIGRTLLDGYDPSNCFLLLSGRVSFELMQKALAARIPLVAAISAPSSLAVEFAENSNQTLVAFLRPPQLNVYSHRQRLV